MFMVKLELRLERLRECEGLVLEVRQTTLAGARAEGRTVGQSLCARIFQNRVPRSARVTVNHSPGLGRQGCC